MRKLLFTPGKIFIRSAMACGLIGTLAFGLSLRKIEPLPLDLSPLHFSAESAYSYTKRLSKGFPNRFTWSDQRRKAGTWLKDEFKKLGYEPKSMPFTEVIAGKQYSDLENIYVEKVGTHHPNEIVVFMAHYDVTDTTSEGAMDDGSGVGVLLELAHVFANQATDRTILFLATDSEEFGAFWGARAFARSFERADKIVAAASFDFVSPEKQTKILTLCDGLKSGYTPLWLRELALNSIRSVGSVEAADFQGLEEFIERALLIPPSDHGAFLAAGIPAFNWVGQTDNFAYVMAHYHHTQADVMEAMEPASFGSYGKSAERFLRSVDSLPRIPADYHDYSYWKISDTVYMEGWGVWLLTILAFIPFVSYSLSKFGRTLKNRPKRRIWGVVKNEAKGVVILLGSLLLGYVVMRLLPTLKVITQYEVHPATQKSLILNSPNFIAILVVVGAVIGVYWVFKRTFSEPEDSVGQLEIRHAVHAAFLSLIIFLAMLKNNYLADLLLLPPAYFWMGLRARKRTEDRILNALFLLGGAITFVAIAIAVSLTFHLGVFYWYLFLAATYGLISANAVVGFLMALTVMIRLFRSFVL